MDKDTLAKFCANDDPRTWMNAPFNGKRFTWATNGHVMIRVPKAEGYPEDVEHAKKCAKLLARYSRALDGRPYISRLPEIPEAETEECPECVGTGRIEDYDEKLVNCLDCGGLGVIEKFVVIEVGAARIQGKYAALIQPLPGLKMRTTKDINIPLHFVFDGGQGLVMQVRV